MDREELKALADEAFGKKDALKDLTKAVAKAWKAVKDAYGSRTFPEQVWPPISHAFMSLAKFRAIPRL